MLRQGDTGERKAKGLIGPQPRVPTGRRTGRWMLGLRTENGHRRALLGQKVVGLLNEDAGSDMAVAAVENEAVKDDHVATTWVRIQKFDRQTNIIYGVVYAPGELDNQGEVMFSDAIEQMAHRFMELDLSTAIDTFHDGVPNGCRPVESFIARKGDPDYPEGAWVMGVRVTDDIADKVERGEVNGFSFDAMTKARDVDVVYHVLRDHVGATESLKSDEADHRHFYFVQFDDKGRVVRGQTDEVNGHSHLIRRASVTEEAGGHNHRYFL